MCCKDRSRVCELVLSLRIGDGSLVKGDLRPLLALYGLMVKVKVVECASP